MILSKRSVQCWIVFLYFALHVFITFHTNLNFDYFEISFKLFSLMMKYIIWKVLQTQPLAIIHYLLKSCFWIYLKYNWREGDTRNISLNLTCNNLFDIFSHSIKYSITSTVYYLLSLKILKMSFFSFANLLSQHVCHNLNETVCDVILNLGPIS